MPDDTSNEAAAAYWSPAAMRARQALELLREIVDGRRPPPPMHTLMGIDMIEVEAGRAVFVGTPGERHFNHIGVAQGGFAATLLDSATACAVLSSVELGQSSTTIEFKINYVRALMPDTGEVRAEGTVIAAGRRIRTAEAHLTDADGRLYAHSTATCLVLTVAPE